MPTLGVKRSIFLGRRTEQLSLLIEEQAIPVFEELGIIVPVRSCSLVTALAELEVASAADLAKHLGQSHQLVLQKIPALTRLKLLDRHNDPEDKRRKVFRLTAAGEKQIALLAEYATLFEKAYDVLNSEIGFNVFRVLGHAIDALENKSLSTRIRELAK